MAKAANTNIVLFKAAPQTAVGEDCTHVSLWTALTSGSFLQAMAISTNPSALSLGEQYEIAALALAIVQPAATGESAAGAERAVRGRILGGVFVQGHTGAPGASGTDNVLTDIPRVNIAQGAFTVTQ